VRFESEAEHFFVLSHVTTPVMAGLEIYAAIRREHNMKHWPRAWKVRLIWEMNPDWHDLYDTLNS
jgi:predicted GIY-YIG superfamily endonuclease